MSRFCEYDLLTRLYLYRVAYWANHRCLWHVPKRLRESSLGLDLGIVYDPLLLCIYKQDLAGLEATLPHNRGIGDLKHAHLVCTYSY